MARVLKNPDLARGSLAVRLPITPSSLGDDPVDGLIKFNSTNSKVEFFYNGAWRQVAQIGTVNLVVDEFTGNGSTVDFVMSQSEASDSAILVTISGIVQTPVNNYIVGSGTGGGFVQGAGTTIRFTSPPPAVDTNGNPNKIVVVHNLNSTDAS